MNLISREEAKAAGAQRYFTGTACRNLHIEERYVSNGLCVECRRNATERHWVGYSERNKDKLKQKDARYRKEKPDVIAATVRKYKENNKESVAVANKAYNERTKEKRAAYNAAYHIQNMGRVKERQQKYRLEKLEELRAAAREYQRANPGKRTAAQMLRQLRKRRATPAWANLDAIKDIYVKAAEQCKHVDHIIPLHGRLVCGLHVEYNLQILDPVLNSKKSNKFIPEDHEWSIRK